MKITILTYGSSGDVLPFIALAKGLNASGNEVSLCAPINFAGTIKSADLTYFPLRSNLQQIFQTTDGSKWMNAKSTYKFNNALANICFAERLTLQHDTLEACKNADAIIAGSLMVYYAAMISEKLQLPMLTANVNPVLALTGDFPHFVVRPRPYFLGLLNKATYILMAAAYEKYMKPVVNPWRVEIGLPELKGSVFLKMLELKTPIVLGYSPALLPKSQAWEDHVVVTGEWKADDDHFSPEQIEVELQNWLKAGPAPIYFGFGSMPVPDPATLISLIKEICAETHSRAILVSGWTNIEIPESDLGSAIYYAKYANLQWLFPQCSSVVIHGGVGTTHICLAAGIPPVICSLFSDNAFWGERLQKLKIGRHIPYNKLTKKRLLKALSLLKKDEPRTLAREYGQKIKAETGVQNAVDFINKYLPVALPYNDWKGKKRKE